MKRPTAVGTAAKASDEISADALALAVAEICATSTWTEEATEGEAGREVARGKEASEAYRSCKRKQTKSAQDRKVVLHDAGSNLRGHDRSSRCACGREGAVVDREGSVR